MPDLREVVKAMGHREVTTYIQSGNVAFAAADPSAEDAGLARALEVEIAAHLGLRPAVVVASREALGRVVRANPFPRFGDPKTLHAVFLPDAPGPEGIGSVAAAVERARAKGSRDDARVVDRTLFLWTPDGFARSVLRTELDRRGRLRTPMQDGTARNWSTVTALVSLLDL